MYYYTATAHKAGGVFSSLILHPPNDVHKNLLVLNQYDGIKLYTLDEKGISEGKFYEIISRFDLLIKIPGPNGEFVFGINDSYYGILMSVNQNGISAISKTCFRELAGDPLEPRPLGFCARNLQYVVLALYKGLLKIFPINQAAPEKTQLNDAFTVRLKYRDLLDICDFSNSASLYGRSQSAVGILARSLTKEGKTVVQFRVYELSLKEKDLLHSKPVWKIELNDETCHKAIVLGPSSVLIIGTQKIYLFKDFESEPRMVTTVSIPAVVLAYDLIDENRVLLGNAQNQLCLLALQEDKMQYEFLGTISYPSDIKYIDNGVLYVSSVVDNPMMVQLKSMKTGDPACPFIEILSKEEHLGSIVDFVPIENKATGVSQLVVCSNHLSNSSVYALGKGISVHQIANTQIPYLSDMWTINFANEHFLAVTFVSESRLLYWDKNKYEIYEHTAPAFKKSNRSLICSKLDIYLVQINENGIYISNPADGFSHIISQHEVKNGPILHAAISSNFIAISDSNNEIHIFELQMETLVEIFTINGEAEISALALTNNLIAFATWDNMLNICEFNSTEMGKSAEKARTKFKIEAEAVARSMEFCRFESEKGQNYLFCGTADGFLISFELNQGQDLLGTCKYISFGTQFVKLKKLILGDSQVLVGCSESATLIHYSGGRLQYSPINLEGVCDIASFNIQQMVPENNIPTATPSKSGVIASSKDVLLIASKGNLMMGIMDDIQKISSVRINLPNVEVRKVTFDEKSGTIVVLADSVSTGVIRGQLMTYSISTYTYEDTFLFDPNESGCSLTTFKGIPGTSEVFFSFVIKK